MMRPIASWSRVLIVVAVVAALSFGTAAMLSNVYARGGCVCPQVYAPVICDKGKVYPNPCVADCRHAKNCVPLGIVSE